MLDLQYWRNISPSINRFLQPPPCPSSLHLIPPSIFQKHHTNPSSAVNMDGGIECKKENAIALLRLLVNYNSDGSMEPKRWVLFIPSVSSFPFHTSQSLWHSFHDTNECYLKLSVSFLSLFHWLLFFCSIFLSFHCRWQSCRIFTILNKRFSTMRQWPVTAATILPSIPPLDWHFPSWQWLMYQGKGGPRLDVTTGCCHSTQKGETGSSDTGVPTWTTYCFGINMPPISATSSA